MNKEPENPQRALQSETAHATAAMSRWDVIAGYTVLRIALGINIAMHGVARLLAGSDKFAEHLSKQFAPTILASPLATAFGHTLPWAEAILGVLVLFGILTRPALILGALLIAVLSFGSCLTQDWNAAGFQLLYALVYALLIVFCQYNTISLDGLRVRK